MYIVYIAVLGLCAGSFVNAFVWRLHENKNWINDRSVCTSCRHELAAIDLVPIISYFLLRGKCRYCHKKISIQYPLIEAVTALIFIASYIYWPNNMTGFGVILFATWLLIVTLFMSLALYDIKWMLLPNKIVYSTLAVVFIYQVIILSFFSSDAYGTLINDVLSVAVGGCFFYAIYQFSKGKWIGGGDVKLGFVLGLLVGSPAKSFLVLFLAALMGSFVALPLIAVNKMNKKSVIPFGPFLIAATIIVVLFGSIIINWYMKNILMI